MHGLRAHLAKIHGTEPNYRTVMSAIERGMPAEKGLLRANGWTFDLDKVDRWLRGEGRKIRPYSRRQK